MTKRGANGTFLVRDGGSVLASGGDGVYDLYFRDRQPRPGAGTFIGRVRRERHTYRTTYRYTRIGYDRTHWCWSGEVPAPSVPGLRCYRTMSDVVGAITSIFKKRQEDAANA